MLHNGEEFMGNVRSLKTEKIGKDVLTRASGWCSDAIGVASEAADSVGEWGNESLDGARKVVRTRPLAACAVSLSIGAIVGLLLLR
jgi:ElaB/YqjD/DUF883 family membrane-anchored ribosome-binding protein